VRHRRTPLLGSHGLSFPCSSSPVAPSAAPLALDGKLCASRPRWVLLYKPSSHGAKRQASSRLASAEGTDESLRRQAGQAMGPWIPWIGIACCCPTRTTNCVEQQPGLADALENMIRLDRLDRDAGRGPDGDPLASGSHLHRMRLTGCRRHSPFSASSALISPPRLARPREPRGQGSSRGSKAPHIRRSLPGSPSPTQERQEGRDRALQGPAPIRGPVPAVGPQTESGARRLWRSAGFHLISRFSLLSPD